MCALRFQQASEVSFPASIYERHHAQVRRAGNRNGTSGISRTGAEAASPSTAEYTSCAARPSCDSRCPKLGANSTERGSCDVSPGTGCNPRWHSCSTRCVGRADLQQQDASRGVCISARRFQHATGIEGQFFSGRQRRTEFAKYRGQQGFVNGNSTTRVDEL